MFEFNDNLNHIIATALYQKYKDEDLAVIDVREPYELLESKLNGAVNIPLMKLLTNYPSLLKKEVTYYILCHTGQRSYYVTNFLTEKGYKVVNIVGGIDLLPQCNLI